MLLLLPMSESTTLENGEPPPFRLRRLADPLLGLSALAALAVAGTLLAIGGRGGIVNALSGPGGPEPRRVVMLLLADIAVLAALAGLIIWRIRALRMARLPPGARSRLQTRVIRTFSLVTVLPTVAISVFSALFFNLSVEAWFNDRVSTAVNESLAVAEAYLEEHRENIRMAALSMAADLNRYSDLAVADPIEFNRIVSAQAASRELTEVVVFQHNRIIAQGRLSFSIAFESLPMSAIEQAAAGQVVILQSASGNEEKVRALAKIDALPDTYLLVGRLVDEKVIEHMENTQGAVAAYRELKANLKRLQWTFSAMFVALALVVLLTVIWYGLVFASRLTMPIARLAAAAERVRAGDYTARAEAEQGNDELSALTRIFNRMVEQLQSQRTELIEANRQLDERRRFSEAVLAGVSAGVIALSAEKRIVLSNRSSAAILRENERLEGRAAAEVLPGIHELLAEAEAGGSAQSSITLPKGGETLTLHVRVSIERAANGAIDRYIVTFDDITPLVAAQRQAAWSDVARRVAHEIKNPLTPIALSAERLKRKYSKFLSGEDAESFTRYAETISRHVADIGRMVEEFVSFARMPGAVMKPEALESIVRKVVFSEQVAHPDIAYRLESAAADSTVLCDERQIAQALTNILKNAAEAIEGMQRDEPKGEIAIALRQEGDAVIVEVGDNGPGFPPDQIHRMLEPYVTTRTKGTGLGLAIVKKIVDEHKGNLQIANGPGRGARIVLSFPHYCDINATD
ncbi:MAG: PAS domain-containing sensor histidine kinase [Alphaproteobacteria bacterium]|nr:PAS domain-containing sensor histidine kinase [Alphaproteobacteria bacterium]